MNKSFRISGGFEGDDAEFSLPCARLIAHLTPPSIRPKTVALVTQGSSNSYVYIYRTGMSELFPHANPYPTAVVDGTTYHIPFDGRKIAMSAFPSPS
jgi:hypothetical protein